jgi:hypothetical protein
MKKTRTILCIFAVAVSAAAADTKLAKNLDGNCSVSSQPIGPQILSAERSRPIRK